MPFGYRAQRSTTRNVILSALFGAAVGIVYDLVFLPETEGWQALVSPISFAAAFILTGLAQQWWNKRRAKDSPN